jgi:NTP pyrophosphatase (non-canonical NTP hydrolase)
MSKPLNKLQQLMVITMEECGELTQECSKIIRKYKEFDELPEKDIDKLKKEAADVYAMLQLMIHNQLFDYIELEVNAKKKHEKLMKWSTLLDE